VGIFVLALIGLLMAPPLAVASDLILYDEALSPAWDDWSWNIHRNFSASTPVHGGGNSLAVTYDQGWAGLYLHAATPIDTSLYDRLRFWIHGGASGGQRLRIVANGSEVQTQSLTASANAWQEVIIPLSSLGSPSGLGDLYWQDISGGPQPVFYLDDIALLAAPPLPQALTIDVSAGRRTISEEIYGMNFADEGLAAELRLPVRRWGGNATSRYNWRTSMTNTVADWYFENLEYGAGPILVEHLPDGSASDQFVEQDRRTGTQSLITIPLIGWTTKEGSPREHPLDCAFKVSKYGAQEDKDIWDPDCGNGVLPGGDYLTGNDPQDTSEAIDPTFVADWIRHLTGKYGLADEGGVAFYNLDNEPMLWDSTHRDIHPQPVTYDEIRDLTFDYAPAIKAVDPGVRTLGPTLWGWCAYFYSAFDGCSPGTDFESHDDLPFVPWYLGQMQAYEQQQGLRLLDYLDLHYYPQADGVALSVAGDAATQALRLGSTRALWDPSYIDESWISDTEEGGVRVQLIPRMRDWVDTWYPGTKIAITEYNWGGLESLNGALAQAEVLGIFGREGLDLASLWDPPTATEPGAFAFRLYRNYDGTGQGFGNLSVQATSANPGQLSVFAAERSRDLALTVIVINKTPNEILSPFSLKGWSLPATAALYRYSAAKLDAIRRLPDQTIPVNGTSLAFPAHSITLFVLPGVGDYCQSGPLTIEDTSFGPGLYRRSSQEGISTQGKVVIGADAEVRLYAPIIRLAPGFRVALAAKLRARAEEVLCDDLQAMSPTLRPSITLVPPSAPMAAVSPSSNSTSLRKSPLARSTASTLTAGATNLCPVQGKSPPPPGGAILFQRFRRAARVAPTRRGDTHSPFQCPDGDFLLRDKVSGAKETRNAPLWRWHDGLNPAPGGPPQRWASLAPFIRRQPPCPCAQLS